MNFLKTAIFRSKIIIVNEPLKFTHLYQIFLFDLRLKFVFIDLYSITPVV